MSYPVVFSVDRNAVPGLHVTLATTLSNTSAPLRVKIFNEHLTRRDVGGLERTCAIFSDKVASLSFETLETSRFSNLRGLHSNKMPFAKLVLPHVVDEDVFCYLDADLCVNLDIVGLFEAHDREALISAVAIGSREVSIEKHLFREMGLDLIAPYFNTGVLVFSGGLCREKSATERLVGIANDLEDRLLNADQTVFNIFNEQEPIAPLPSQYNTIASPYKKVPFSADTKAIFHFVGSPKPWDPFGRRLSPNFHIFEQASRMTGIDHRFGLRAISPRSIVKTIRTSRSILRRLKLDRFVER